MIARKCFKNRGKQAFLRWFFAIVMVLTGVLGVFGTSMESVYAEPDTDTTNVADGDSGTTDDDTNTTGGVKLTDMSTDNCQSNLGGMAWLVCTITGTTSGAVDWLYSAIEGLLVVNPVEAKDGTPIYEIWKYCKGITNVVFIVFLLIVIYSQITGVGISNYGVKKALPKLIVAAVLVNLSFLICQLGIDVSNVIGNGLRGLFTSVENSVLTSMEVSVESIAELKLTYAHLYNSITAGSVLAIGGAVLSFESGAIWMLIPLILGALAAVVSGLITIALRQALVALLVMIAPLAIVAMILPNTEILFQKWRKLLMRMLVFYPMFSLLFGASSLAGFAIMASAKDGFWLILGMAVQVLPLFFSWSLMKMSGTILGDINARFRGVMSKKVASSRAWAESQRQATRTKNLVSGRVYTPSAALRQFMTNRQIAREAETAENLEELKKRGLAYRSSLNYDKNGAATKAGADSYAQQARMMQYEKIIERDKNNMNKGLGQLEAQPGSMVLRARLAQLDIMNVEASDSLKMEKARGEIIEYENAKGFHARMEDAVNAHFDSIHRYDVDKDGNSIYRVHDIQDRAAAERRYAMANEVMEGSLKDTQYAAATAAQDYDTQRKIRETKMGKYFELAPPTRDVEYRLGELTTAKDAADNIDAIVAGLRVLNQRGDTDLMRKQLENVLNGEDGVKLGTHASQALASFLMFEVKDNDPTLRRFGKYINLETARVYNKNQRQNDRVSLDEYFTGEYEDWEPGPVGSDPGTTPRKMRVGRSKRAAATLLEGTSFDGVERTAYSNLDEMLINTYTKDGTLDVKKYLEKRQEIETAIGPAFISASLKYLSGSEQLKSAVSFLTGYDGDTARWEDKENPLYGNEDAEEYFRGKTLKYIKDQTPNQILAMRSDYKVPLINHLADEYEENGGKSSDEDERKEYQEFMDKKAEIQTRYGDEDAATAEKKRKADMGKLRMEMASVQMRRILGDTGKLNQIFKTRTSGTANGAKDWLREMVLLDDERALRNEVAHFEKKKREEYERTHKESDAADDGGVRHRIYDELDKENFMAEMSSLREKIRDAEPMTFYAQTRDKMSKWFGEDSYIVWRYEKWYKDNKYADNADIYDFIKDLLGDLDNYPGNDGKK